MKESENKHIIAMKDGLKKKFSITAWELCKNSRNGWELMSSEDEDSELKLEIKEVDFGERLGDDDEKITVEDISADKPELTKTEQIELTPDEMRILLKEKGVKFHHKTGDKKIKEIYDENTK